MRLYTGTITLLSGDGTINRAITFKPASMLAPGNAAAGTLTLVGNVTMDNTMTTTFDLGTTSDQVAITGDLSLDGVIDVSEAAGFAAGTYTIFTCSSSLTDNTATIGSVPAGSNVTLDTSEGGKVKLVVTLGPKGTIFLMR